MSDWFKPNSWGDYIGAVFLMVVFFAGIIVFWNVALIPSKSSESPSKSKIVDCPSDYDSFASTTKKITLLENMPSNGANGILKGYVVSLERTGLTSEIVCGYLLYDISFDSKPIEQKFMSLLMNPSGSKLGGHIWPDENRGAIIQEKGDYTEVLMPLTMITYDGTSKQTIEQSDWAALLNVSNKIDFDIGLSADTPDGKINLVQLAYKCINKDTGEQTEICNLKVSSVKSTTI